MVLDPEWEAELRRRAKQQIRQRMRALRSTIPEDARAERSTRLVSRVAESEPFETATEVALFAPMLSRGEVDIRPLAAIARARGKRVAFPALTGDANPPLAPQGAVRDGNDARLPPRPPDMVFRRATLADLLDKGHGFDEPPDAAPTVKPHEHLLIVVPALAIDGRGQRIGYGAGFYDRALGRFVPPATTMAVGFDFQVLADVPADDWDIPVDWVFTDTRFFRTKPATRA